MAKINVIAYICDQEDPHCKKWCRTLYVRPRVRVSECRHTFDTTHAKNGTIDPRQVELYPDRFKRVCFRNGIEYYEEVQR